MNQTVFVGHARGWPLPEVIVEPGGYGAGLEGVGPALVGIPRFGQIHPPNDAFVQRLDALCQHRGRPPLGTHLHHTVIFPGGGHGQFALVGVVAQGFFYVHVLPGGAAHNRERSVPVVGCGDVDGVDGFVFEHLPAVFFRLGRQRLFRFQNGLNRLRNGPVIDVADGTDFGVLKPGEGATHAVAPAVDPNGGHPDQFVGSDNTVIAFGRKTGERPAHGQRSRPGSRLFYKITSGWHEKRSR